MGAYVYIAPMSYSPSNHITVNGHLVAVPKGAIAYKCADPIEDERWLYTDDEVQEIRREDPSLVVMVDQHYTITDDRISQTPDVVTADELRDYLASMNESNDWNLDLDTLEVDETGASIVLDGEPVIVARPT